MLKKTIIVSPENLTLPFQNMITILTEELCAFYLILCVSVC